MYYVVFWPGSRTYSSSEKAKSRARKSRIWQNGFKCRQKGNLKQRSILLRIALMGGGTPTDSCWPEKMAADSILPLDNTLWAQHSQSGTKKACFCKICLCTSNIVYTLFEVLELFCVILWILLSFCVLSRSYG